MAALFRSAHASSACRRRSVNVNGERILMGKGRDVDSLGSSRQRVNDQPLAVHRDAEHSNSQRLEQLEARLRANNIRSGNSRRVRAT
jgi:hypothetical protein